MAKKTIVIKVDGKEVELDTKNKKFFAIKSWVVNGAKNEKSKVHALLNSKEYKAMDDKAKCVALIDLYEATGKDKFSPATRSAFSQLFTLRKNYLEGVPSTSGSAKPRNLF